ncbi:MAG: UDP-N-acetyl-D-mannosamine dehydrogenase [Bacteroidetes bacterium B1(2017)]|nr:MAG: UDP-N-acetyl-D-mannosamine dehydrogenase [Bacteroidetes bacterium B1(2017)]
MQSNAPFQKICVLGLGYIGLPTAALLANRGFDVLGVDVLPHVVNTINSGQIHIVEPGLDTFVKSAIMSGKLRAALSPEEADVFIIAVPTPFHEGFIPNVDYVVSATKSIAPFVKKGNVVLLESTSPVGTTELMAKTLKDEGKDIEDLFIAHCPERVLPGQVMRELIQNDRVVGGVNSKSTEMVKSFYEKFVEGEVIGTDARTAELCKLVENASRDVNIAFANELSMICDQANINVWELITLANRHPRVNILRPGSGVGGHCIAVDPWFIVSAFPEYSKVIKTARQVNDYKTLWVIEKIKYAALQFNNQNNKVPIIACFGLAFKPDIDDLRESPAIEIYHQLKKESFNLMIVEPNILNFAGEHLEDPELAVQNADICCFLVSHKEFKGLPQKAIDLNKIVINVTGV